MRKNERIYKVKDFYTEEDLLEFLNEQQDNINIVNINIVNINALKGFGYHYYKLFYYIIEFK